MQLRLPRGRVAAAGACRVRPPGGGNSSLAGRRLSRLPRGAQLCPAGSWWPGWPRGLCSAPPPTRPPWKYPQACPPPPPRSLFWTFLQHGRSPTACTLSQSRPCLPAGDIPGQGAGLGRAAGGPPRTDVRGRNDEGPCGGAAFFVWRVFISSFAVGGSGRVAAGSRGLLPHAGDGAQAREHGVGAQAPFQPQMNCLLPCAHRTRSGPQDCRRDGRWGHAVRVRWQEEAAAWIPPERGGAWAGSEAVPRCRLQGTPRGAALGQDGPAGGTTLGFRARRKEHPLGGSGRWRRRDHLSRSPPRVGRGSEGHVSVPGSGAFFCTPGLLRPGT